MSGENPRIEGVGARRAALQMLDSVLRRGETLASTATRVRGLSPQDSRLAQAIAGEVLRRLPLIDSWVDSATRHPLPDDNKARMVLRIALAQKLGLDTPDHALVATALPLVDGGPRRLVHGVLGTLLRGPVPNQVSPLPAPVELRWIDQWGEEVVASARAEITTRPPLDLAFKTDALATDFAAATGAKLIAPRAARLDSANPTGLPGFDSGDWWVQDIAASLPGRLVPAAAARVLDLAAAPGGKTMQLAAAGHKVTALDIAEKRNAVLRANLKRTGLNAEIVTADALQWNPDESFDAILLDAPCSATGTFRRHPEVLYRARPAIIAEMADLQYQLLGRASGWLKPGGSLVYATCSLERAEGEVQLERFLAGNPGFRIHPPRTGEMPDFVPVSADGTIRVLPGVLAADGGADGFFIARLVAPGG